MAQTRPTTTARVLQKVLPAFQAVTIGTAMGQVQKNNEFGKSLSKFGVEYLKMFATAFSHMLGDTIDVMIFRHPVCYTRAKGGGNFLKGGIKILFENSVGLACTYAYTEIMVMGKVMIVPGPSPAAEFGDGFVKGLTADAVFQTFRWSTNCLTEKLCPAVEEKKASYPGQKGLQMIANMIGNAGVTEWARLGMDAVGFSFATHPDSVPLLGSIIHPSVTGLTYAMYQTEVVPSAGDSLHDLSSGEASKTKVSFNQRASDPLLEPDQNQTEKKGEEHPIDSSRMEAGLVSQDERESSEESKSSPAQRGNGFRTLISVTLSQCVASGAYHALRFATGICGSTSFVAPGSSYEFWKAQASYQLAAESAWEMLRDGGRGLVSLFSYFGRREEPTAATEAASVSPSPRRSI